jgi:hypothetical protein
MTETLTKTLIEPSERATSWLEGLAARGVTVTVRNNRLWLHPASAHRSLTDDEVLTLRHHRSEIKALVREGRTYATTTVEPTAAAPVQPPAPCDFCYQSPCIGREHPAFATLHALDPQEVTRRSQDANDAIDQLIAREQQWPTSRIIEKARAREPKLTEQEQRQATVRSRLGWDASSRRV